MSNHQRPALDVLADLRRGRLHADLTDALHELITACTDTGKKGELTLKLTIDPKKVGDYDTPRMEVTDSISVKKPRRAVSPSIFYLTDDGNPVRTDPNQEAFAPLREVPVDITEPTRSANREAN